MDGFGGAGGVGAAERKMVEADRKEAHILFGPCEGLGNSADDFGGLALGEEEVAVAMPRKRVEDREFGFALGLDALGFVEEAERFDEVAGVMEGAREGGTLVHSLK